MAETFGEMLKRLRQEKTGLGLNEFAKTIPIAASTLSDYEHDKRIPPDSLLRVLAKKFDVPFDLLKQRSLDAEVDRILRADQSISEESRRQIADFYKWARDRDREATERRRRGE